MMKITGITIAALAAIAVAGGITACDADASSRSADSEPLKEMSTKELAQAPVAVPGVTEATPGTDTTVTDSDADADSDDEADALADRPANEAPEMTKVTGQFVKSDDSPVSGGVVYFVFQNRLNEIPHSGALEKAKTMIEAAASVDDQGNFTLRIKPGNFAMIYDPAATEAPTEPGANSMTVMKRLTKEQVQGRIAAIKENAATGLPIENGKLGTAYVIENNYIRPPISNFSELQLQNPGVVTVKAVDDKGELINFPATLRLRGKNGDIMEPHTPSVSTRAQYSFHDLMPQPYQVFALGTRPRPGGGDEVTTPTVANDQFVFTGDSLTQEVVVNQPSE